MEMLGHSNKKFKNIFPNYQLFRDWYVSLPISDDSEDVPSEKTFSLIAYEYNDSTVNFSEESFKEHFAIDLYTYYKEFEETTKSIIDLMKLTDEDISVADSMIINTADIPEHLASTNAETVDFVSSQQKHINKKGVLQVKKEQLSNKRILTVKTFLKRFKHLFIKILSPAYNLVVSEPEEV